MTLPEREETCSCNSVSAFQNTLALRKRTKRKRLKDHLKNVQRTDIWRISDDESWMTDGFKFKQSRNDNAAVPTKFTKELEAHRTYCNFQALLSTNQKKTKTYETKNVSTGHCNDLQFCHLRTDCRCYPCKVL